MYIRNGEAIVDDDAVQLATTSTVRALESTSDTSPPPVDAAEPLDAVSVTETCVTTSTLTSAERAADIIANYKKNVEL